MFQDVGAWLIGAESREHELEHVMNELARRLIEKGLPLWRLNGAVLAMHPEVFARVVRWSRGLGVSVSVTPRDIVSSPAFVGSSVDAIIRGGVSRVHARLERGEVPFKQLAELKGDGGTDYAGFALELGRGRRTFLSLATDAIGGFTESQLAAFEAILPALAIRLELESTRFSSETLLQLYLGKNAASRVLAGDFRRGTGQVIPAAIWLCDLRGFTRLADRLPLAELVPVLDAYFEAMSGPVQEKGGEILKFIGDSILAVFPTEGNAAGACRRAVEAAVASLAAFAALPSAGAHELAAGVAVNLGDVMYGNVGAPDRLDFTVIGSAVNETARMEAMCKELGTALVIAEAVAAHLDASSLVPLGRHALRGVSGERTLFTRKP